MAATVLGLAACDPAKRPSDSTSTTTVIDSNAKTTTVTDSAKPDTVKLADQKTTGKKSGGALSNTSLQAVKDSIKKDSAKLSRK